MSIAAVDTPRKLAYGLLIMRKICKNGSELRADDVRRLLAEYCQERGAQSALAKRLGVSRAYISNVIKGIAPPSRKICSVLRLREDGARWVPE